MQRALEGTKLARSRTAKPLESAPTVAECEIATTSAAPWDPDRPLSLETARAVVQAVLGEASANTARPLGSGWDFDAYVSDQGWVIRFPRRVEAQVLLDREGPILELVRSTLPASVAVPKVRLLDHRVEGFPYRVAVHPFIVGIPADQVDQTKHDVLARSLGDALGRVHSIPLVAALEAGLVELDRNEKGRVEWFDQGTAGLMDLRGSRLGLDEPLAWLAELKDPLRRLEAPLRVIHHDLSPEHLLVNEETGQLSGILDWTDAILGDAARDFVPLVTFGGWPFMEHVLMHYRPGVDVKFRFRLRFMARLLPLMWLGHAHVRGEDIRKHVSWVRNAFADQGAF